MAANSTKRKRSDSEVPDTIPEPVSLNFSTATESGVEDHPVPTKVNSIKSYGYLKSTPSREPHMVVARCTQEMSGHQRGIKPEEQQAVFDILKSFNSLGRFSADVCKSLRIRAIVLNILGETKVDKGPFEYPEPLQRNAFIILNRMDAEIAAEQVLEKPESPEPEAQPLKRRRQSRSQLAVSELSRQSIEDSITFKHVMRGISIGGKSRRSYTLDKHCHPAPRNHQVFGHNELEVGDWWPQRICVLRDGAHGSMQGGIAGSSTTGAYSIVVSSTSFVQSCLLAG